MSTLLDVRNVSKRFTMGGLLSRKTVDAVQDASLSLSAETPEIFTIIGESGSGKTTLARMILGLELPTDGEISFRFLDATGMKSDKDGHMRNAVLKLVDNDHLDANWQFFQDGKPAEHHEVFKYTRVK